MAGTVCAACGHLGRDGSRFCTGCGASLAAGCPSCGHPAEAGERFCGRCGTALPAGHRAPTPVEPSPEGERKQVTVLFADVARSMELAEQFDADEWTQIITGLFDVCAEAVRRFGGTVDKFTGDGLMALFGAPLAQEDHAARACHAALALQVAATDYATKLTVAHGIALDLRVGLNSGEVAPVTALAAGDLTDALHALCAAELLQVTGGGEYRFWHPLTQEVAYASLLAASRRHRHYAVAHALIASSPDRLEELAPLVATHFEAAGKSLEAARWQIRSALLLWRTDFAETARQLRAAIRHLSRVPESPEALELGLRARCVLIRLGARTGMDPAEADLLVTEARALADRLGNPGPFADVAMAAFVSQVARGEHTAALHTLQEFRGAAEKVGGPEGRELLAICSFDGGIVRAWAGPVAQGVQYATASRELWETQQLTGLSLVGYSSADAALVFLAMLHLAGGRLPAAREAVVEALACYEVRPVAEWRAITLALLGELADRTGEPADLAEAAAAAVQALELSRDAGSSFGAVRALQAAGLVSLLVGRPDEAAATFGRALSEARAMGVLMDEAGLLAYLARACLASHDAPSARAAATEAVEVAQRQGAVVIECMAHVVRARVWRETATSQADRTEARAAVAAGVAVVAETGAVTWTPFLAEEHARLDDDRDALAAAADGYDAIGATGHARRVREELAL